MQIPYNRYGADYSRRRSHFSFQSPEAEGDLLGYGFVSTNPAITRMLTKGRRGADVKALQSRLIELGFLEVDDDDGIFGSRTKTAVQAFQSSVGNTPSGAVGRATIAALWPAAASAASAASSFDPSSILTWLSTAQTATEYFTPRGRRRRARRTPAVSAQPATPGLQPTVLETEFITDTRTGWKKWALAAAGGLTLLLIVLVVARRR